MIHLFIYLLIYLCLCWVFISVRGLSLVTATGGPSSSQYAGLSLSRLLLLWSTGSRRVGSVIVAHRPSCSVACGIFPDQVSNPCPLHWQTDSQPLHHQGSPSSFLLVSICMEYFFHPLTFSLYVSLGPKWVSYRQYIYRSCLCIHSASLCLLVGAFNLFTFKVIIHMYVPIAIFLIVLGFFYRSFFFPSSPILFSCGLMTIFSIMFWLLFLLCVCIYCSFGLCCSDQVLM